MTSSKSLNVSGPICSSGKAHVDWTKSLVPSIQTLYGSLTEYSKMSSLKRALVSWTACPVRGFIMLKQYWQWSHICRPNHSWWIDFISSNILTLATRVFITTWIHILPVEKTGYPRIWHNWSYKKNQSKIIFPKKAGISLETRVFSLKVISMLTKKNHPPHVITFIRVRRFLPYVSTSL